MLKHARCLKKLDLDMTGVEKWFTYGEQWTMQSVEDARQTLVSHGIKFKFRKDIVGRPRPGLIPYHDKGNESGCSDDDYGAERG